MNILDKIAKATALRVEERKKRIPVETLEPGKITKDFPFEQALKKPGMSFICEVKKASPSKGIIAEDFPYRQIAKEYQNAGADCISVLTEPDFFQGNDRYLTEIKESVDIPVLRKDFIIDEYQIYEAKAIGADAVLLICALLDQSRLLKFFTLAGSLGLSALVEAHNERELTMALAAGARIIGVNNRDLKTFKVDLNNSRRFRRLVPLEVAFVAESGITGREDIKLLEDAGVDAVLIGETLMRSKNKRASLSALKGEAYDQD